MKKPITRVLACRFAAWQNCNKTENTEWRDKWAERINNIVELHFPHGAGFDNKMEFNFEESKSERLVIDFEFHHMRYGYYTRWSEHKLIIKPSLAYGFAFHITGRKYGIDDYLDSTFNIVLTEHVEEFPQ